jgi:hypothetical protein
MAFLFPSKPFPGIWLCIISDYKIYSFFKKRLQIFSLSSKLSNDLFFAVSWSIKNSLNYSGQSIFWRGSILFKMELFNLFFF